MFVAHWGFLRCFRVGKIYDIAAQQLAGQAVIAPDSARQIEDVAERQVAGIRNLWMALQTGGIAAHEQEHDQVDDR